MLTPAEEAISFLDGKNRSDLEKDRMLALSLVKCIEIIGEAAANITKETQRRFNDVPWPAIVVMRNRLVHGYFPIDLDRVHDTVIDDLPPLVKKLKKIISEMERD